MRSAGMGVIMIWDVTHMVVQRPVAFAQDTIGHRGEGHS